jgi:tetratricopeptide (TPR) repeat protein
MSENAPRPKTLFISRASADADFAAVVGAILKDAGYSVILQQWDFANRNFMERMHAALAEGARVIALLSPEYLQSQHCQAEWQNAIAGDPLNTKSRLIVLRVAECEPVGLLSALAYWDLVPVRDNRAMLNGIVLDAVSDHPREKVPSGPHWRAPRSINDAESIHPVAGFSGRDAELAALSSAFTSCDGIAVVCGLGGVGKSSIAREYAWRTRNDYAVVWWLNAESEDGIVNGLLRLGSLLVRGFEQHADRRGAAQQVIGSMLSGFAKPVLLIFDNLEEEGLLRTWRPRANSHVLATSRNASWPPGITVISLTTWALETSIEYLQRESGRSDLSTQDARSIAEALGALPLALSHAAASLRAMRMITPDRYLERITEHLRKAPRGAEYPSSVFATLSSAVAQAEKEAPGASALLCFAACFAPDAIPDELFRQSIERYSNELQAVVADDLQLDETLGALDRLSLLAFSEASRTYRIHRLVQLAALDRVAGDRLAWAQCAISVADSAFPQADFKTWPQCERLLPHARAALDVLPEEIDYVPAGRLAYRCGSYLAERGEYVVAEPILLRACTLLEKTLGPNDSEVGLSLRELAAIYYYLGRYSQAEPLMLQALGIQESTLGQQHPKVAVILSDLAILRNKQARYEEMEPLYTRALAIQERSLGAESPDVATTLSNLAVHYAWQGRYDDAESASTRALAIRERALGPDHPQIATSLNNLGKVYYRQGRYDELIPLMSRALAILERTIGPHHPDVAHALNNLALVHVRQQRYDEAKALILRALDIRQKAFGEDHAEVGVLFNTLAQLHEAQGLFDEARTSHARVLAIRERVFGLDHPEVASSLVDLAKLSVREESHDKAEPLYARALAIREKTLGTEHALTAAVREELSSLRAHRMKE